MDANIMDDWWWYHGHTLLSLLTAPTNPTSPSSPQSLHRIRCCFLKYQETSEAASTHVGGFCPLKTTTIASFRCTIFIHVVETLLNRFSAFNPFVLLNMHISGILHWLWFDLKFQTSLLLLSPLFSQLEQFRQCGIRDHYFLNFLLVNLSDVPTKCLVL